MNALQGILFVLYKNTGRFPAITQVNTQAKFKAKFTRLTEDFICEVCATPVQGTGYTNHCTCCLHSKHVDINPGDRASPCRGLMRPVGRGRKKKKGDFIIHRCLLCGLVKNNKVAGNDSEDEINKLPW